MARSNSFLMDTHIFIWAMEGGKKLPLKTKDILQNSENEIFLSVASVWEIVIKQAKGRLRTPRNVEESVRQTGFNILPIEISHALEVAKLPSYHNDPFDRMLIAQAKVEKLNLITADQKIKKYDIPTI